MNEIKYQCPGCGHTTVQRAGVTVSHWCSQSKPRREREYEPVQPPATGLDRGR